MKIFEYILDNRIRDIVEITMNQAGFVKNCGTTDAIYAARLLMEKHREKHRPLYIAFLDLEKAFDRVPHELIWYALQHHLVPEELVRSKYVGRIKTTSCLCCKNDLEQPVQKWNDRLINTVSD